MHKGKLKKIYVLLMFRNPETLQRLINLVGVMLCKPPWCSHKWQQILTVQDWYSPVYRSRYFNIFCSSVQSIYSFSRMFMSRIINRYMLKLRKACRILVEIGIWFIWFYQKSGSHLCFCSCEHTMSDCTRIILTFWITKNIFHTNIHSKRPSCVWSDIETDA